MPLRIPKTTHKNTSWVFQTKWLPGVVKFAVLFAFFPKTGSKFYFKKCWLLGELKGIFFVLEKRYQLVNFISPLTIKCASELPLKVFPIGRDISLKIVPIWYDKVHPLTLAIMSQNALQKNLLYLYVCLWKEDTNFEVFTTHTPSHEKGIRLDEFVPHFLG